MKEIQIQPALERLGDVIRRTGISRTTLYRLAAIGAFPKPVKMGFCSAWVESEVTDWINERIAARNNMEAQ